MLRPSEIAIGDLICNEYGNVAKVEQIYYVEDVYHKRVYLVEHNRSSSVLAMCKPIQLSEDIFARWGFEKRQCEDLNMSCLDKDNYCITYSVENGCQYLTIENVVDNDKEHTSVVLKNEVYNVHEFQHALRICGLDNFADSLK